MPRRWLLVPMLLLASAPLAAQRPAAAPVRADTPVARPTGAATPIAAGVRAGTPAAAVDTPAAAPAAGAGAALRLGLEPIAPIFPLDLPAPPGLGALWLRPRFEDWAAEWGKRTRSVLEARRTALWFDRRFEATPPAVERREDLPRPRRGGPPVADVVDRRTPREPTVTGAQRDSAVAAAAARADSALTKAKPILPAGLAEYADLGMKVTGRGELGGAWNRYHPCDPTLRLACNPSLFPQLKPDVQFGVLVAGTISDRLHVDVDYDQRREFDAANNINVYYQGFEDEVLQRVEVGDVSIRLPQSRYLTEGIPAGNFGFKATGQVGPMDFQAVWAQQKGDISKREFRLDPGSGGGQQGLVQDATAVLDDAAYVKGQFYFLVRPDSLRGAPDVDVLKLQALDAPASLRPKTGTDIAIFRDERISPANQQQQGQVGYFLARAVSDDGRTKHEGFFRRLTPNVDYVVHPSGLWITLRSPLRQDEALAIAYVSEAGDTIGDVRAEAAPPGTTPVLRLIGGDAAIHQPGQPTWDYEMHHVYRIDSSNGVDVRSVRLDISVGELSGGKTFAQVNGKSLTFLKLLGLDEVSPSEQLDEERLYQPGTTGFDTKVTGTYLIFPTLRPFADPPPVPSENLTAADTKAALGADANPAIYDNADPIARESAARFRLNFKYRVSVESGVVSTLNLGALGIRDGSERIYIGGQLLERGKDYNIDYDIGTVTLINPEALFATNPGAEVRATWEQKALFQKAPTSVFGLNSRFQLGKRGELNFIGLYQAERSLMTRPELGLEPGSIFLGGSSARLDLGGSFLDHVLARVPGLRVNAPSSVNLAGEVALSAPNPNRHGDTYLDDFEATDETAISLARTAWKLGSRPEARTGAEDVFPSILDVTTAGKLVWQDIVDNGTGPRALFLVGDIDKQIVVSGTQQGEPALELTFGGGGQPGARRWRSLTTAISTTGRDLSRSEYIEFYVARDRALASTPDLALVLDLGEVSEDAYYFDADGRTNGTYPDGKPWGLGVLDEEASLARHEIWSSALDAAGLWNQPCQAERGKIYPEGDERANCTKGNGIVDTEDLDGNGVPSLTDGAYFRYVVKLDGTSRYLVRDTTQTGTRFQLYRIPLRDLAKVSVGGAGEGTW
ncbi:MAG: cell surface protein SprA, partial [Gemmatimonadetes bacterium]|nr:cell surface protein SprA [Gemmatimonadota bacterium]